ncbi:leucine-rich repeat domain-containing protein [Gymnodinialimonas sp.]
MTEAEQAFAAAEAEIARVAEAGATMLDLSGEAYRALEEVPEGITELKDLRHLKLNYTQIRDLAHISALRELFMLHLDHTRVRDLSNVVEFEKLSFLSLDDTEVIEFSEISKLTRLEYLYLSRTQVEDLTFIASLKILTRAYFNGTKISNLNYFAELSDFYDIQIRDTAVRDLRPLLSCPALATHERRDMRFEDTEATRQDPELARLAEIEGDQERVDKTLAYLRTLPEWPAPLPSSDVDSAPEGEPKKPPLTAEILIESQDLSGWRFSPVHGAMELFVRDVALEERQKTLAILVAQRIDFLKNKLEGRSNSGGLRQDVFEEASRLGEILNDDSRSLSLRSLEMWASLIALGDHLDANDKGALAGRDPLDLLNQEGRAALSTLIGIAASLVRSFPEARALDDDHGSFERRAVTVEMVAELIAAALRANFVDEKSAALVQHVGQIATHHGTQAEKASSVNRAGGKNLITAAALLMAAPAGVVAQGALADVGTDISNSFRIGEHSTDLVKHAIDFLTEASGDISAFIASLTPDERSVLNAAIEDAKKNQHR